VPDPHLADVVEETSHLHQTQFSQFFAELIHEVSNPLIVLTLNLEMLNALPEIRKSSDAKERIKMLLHSVEQLRSILRHSQQHLSSSVNEVIHLNAEILHVLSLLKAKAAQGNIILHFQAKKELYVRGNAVRFFQVMFNLLINALDSFPIDSSETNKQVKVQLSSSKNMYHITVQDWGVGIPPDQIQHIFQLFYTSKSGKKGSGVGLFLAKKIIEKEFLGTLTVQSEVNKGTCFTISIPR
jgi:two-component system NtrC family sensor kinase